VVKTAATGRWTIPPSLFLFVWLSGAAGAEPLLPSARVLAPDVPVALSAEPKEVAVSFFGAGRIVRFENLPKREARLVITDGMRGAELWTDAGGNLTVAGPPGSGRHTIAVLPPDQTRVFTLMRGAQARLHRRGWIALALLLLASIALWAAWGKGSLPEAPPAALPAPAVPRRVLSIAAGTVLLATVALYAARVWSASGRVAFPAANLYEAFCHSQFIVGGKDPAVSVMTDQDIYAWAGWMDAHGTPPHLVNPEHPPLGKYFLGAAGTYFGSPVVATFAAGLAAIAGLTVAGRGALASWPLALLAASLTASGRLLADYTTGTFLEIFVLALGVWGIAGAARVARRRTASPGSILALDALLGVGMAVKWSFAVFALVVVVVLARAGRFRSIAAFLAGLPVAMLAYGLAYARSFRCGLSFADFLAFQVGVASRWKWVNLSVHASPFGIWRILFLGVPDYSPARVPGWSPLWPIAGALAIAATVVALRRGQPYAVGCGAWFAGQLVFFIGKPSWERYIVPILPVAVILALVLWTDRETPRSPIAHSPAGEASHSG
jgi:hypothetical protein